MVQKIVCNILIHLLWKFSDDAHMGIYTMDERYLDVPIDLKNESIKTYCFDFVLSNKKKCMKWLNSN